MLMKDKVGLITGGGSGMGMAAALELAREGATVVLAGRTEDKLRSARERIVSQGGSAEIYIADAASREDNESLVAFVESRFGRLDFAFNNAGGHGEFHPIHETPIEEAEWVIDLNFKGVYYGVKYQVEAMLRSGGGSIVNNASIFGLRGVEGIAHYVASKHAVVGLTKAVAKEYAKSNIRVNAICPGATETPNYMRSTGGDVHLLDEMIPMRRIGQPHEVGKVVLWMLSDQAKYVTGSTLSVDGGMSI
ncbi:A-factor type gamma-butyrolactone 1'-reductase (1S-forming) [Paraburkholderia caffeinitolerans]|uniref:A-factor type gamma-butyrolactone 1'-reductase (1S-forming) n=1 Tax=Paraburkholderia caffeinitolerans TaxID=1723730 RepID=A0A6J5FWY8_9BURK|nr:MULTISPECIES: SDR family NAD(P)-dependent oxidoreductase [Paraburkholderia]CAB3788730.1 A-factor type gamma-butyrolactone 1'-reductase (1S-forming) [Paraburkholderia caffeinitolerans]